MRGPRSAPRPQNLPALAQAKSQRKLRLSLSGRTGEEINRVLGGGVVHGSLVLVGGDPGVGKSTLLLQVRQGRGAHVCVVCFCPHTSSKKGATCHGLMSHAMQSQTQRGSCASFCACVKTMLAEAALDCLMLATVSPHPHINLGHKASCTQCSSFPHSAIHQYL